MTIEEMKQRKQELGYTVADLAQLTGVPRGTLQKIFSGKTRSPRRETIEKITAVLEKKPNIDYQTPPIVSDGGMTYGTGAMAAASPSDVDSDEDSDGVPDNPYGTKKQGEYTVEDYLALPDDKRYELIDGVLYDMASPTGVHQLITGYLYYRLMSCADEHDMPCLPCIAPLDVQLDKDNKTMVQPDVLICCDTSQGVAKRVYGAPDFAAEVLSPSTRRKDIFIKMSKYKDAGVREYWMIDPDKEKVTVILFDEEDDISVYSFDDDIPVSISEGLCSVRFADVRKWMG